MGSGEGLKMFYELITAINPIITTEILIAGLLLIKLIEEKMRVEMG